MSKCLQKSCACVPQRYVMCVLIVLGLITCYLMRVSLNLAITEMTFKLPKKNITTEREEYCPPGEKANKTVSRAEFHWSSRMQHSVIKAIYIGYIIAHVPAGVISDTFGGKHVYGGGILLSSVLSLCFPFLARLSPYAFMAGRVLQGFGQGVMFPSTSALVAKWAPPNERATMTGIIQSGVMMGNASGFMISGVILDMFPGWDPIFYFCGVLGLIWCACWYAFCYSSPASHPFITDKEKEMIETQIALTAKEKPKHIPWCAILTSCPVLSLMTMHFGHTWALFTLVNELPSYMSKVLNFDVKSSGLYSALPHVAMNPTAIATGFVCDYLTKNNIQSVTNNRKMFCFVANVFPIPFMIGASFAGCDRTLVIALLMVMMLFKGLTYATAKTNPIDLSPNYAGMIMGLMNGSGAFAGLISPMLTPLFLTGDGTLSEWRNVFYLAGCVMFSVSVPYLFCGSGVVQSWNNVDSSQQAPEAQPAETQETKA